MPSRFLLQPNGKLACFSTIVDNFTRCNLTKEEAFVAAFEDMGRSEAEGKVARGLARGLEAQGGWNECLETIRMIHGPDTCAAVVAEILGSAPDDEDSDFLAWADLAALVERASEMRSMTLHERTAYRLVVEQLREAPLAGRRCKGCGGPILQRPFPEGATNSVTFDYDCTCPGSEPLDKSLPWVSVPSKAEGVSLGMIARGQETVVSRYRSHGSTRHRIHYRGDGDYLLSWVVDYYYEGTRGRFPRGFTRTTDRRGAERFAKRWKIEIENDPQTVAGAGSVSAVSRSPHV